MIHHLIPRLVDRAIDVRLVGCGGTGSQMLTGLARLHVALRALGRPGLRVTTQDPDTVSPANIGRQLFAAADIGHPKAVVLTHRINCHFGLDWTAHPTAWRPTDSDADIILSCVDTRKARAAIHHSLTCATRRTRPCAYWLDLGNRAADGQVVLGEPARTAKDRKRPDRLPTVAELYPEIIAPGREDNTPSCSLAEALEQQELFVNQAVATFALALLWQLLRHGRIDYHGAHINLAALRVAPLRHDPGARARAQRHPARSTAP